MYNWAYIQDATLAKLDMDEYDDQAEVVTTNLINRFKTYANEAISQICSAVKPQRKYYTCTISEDLVNIPITITDPLFISFSDDNSKYAGNVYGLEYVMHCNDELLEYEGYNTFVCKQVGTYKIAYNAKWCDFTNIEEDEMINAPDDVVHCIPSYIASQCYKVDDEAKASVFRNEYEMFLARIDDTDFKNTHDIIIGGDW